MYILDLYFTSISPDMTHILVAGLLDLSLLLKMLSDFYVCCIYSNAFQIEFYHGSKQTKLYQGSKHCEL